MYVNNKISLLSCKYLHENIFEAIEVFLTNTSMASTYFIGVAWQFGTDTHLAYVFPYFIPKKECLHS